MLNLVLLLGGGDLGSGVALRLHRVGVRLLIAELPKPLAVRRLVSFAEAVYAGQATVEGVTARHSENLPQALSILEQGQIPVLTVPWQEILNEIRATPAGLQASHHSYYSSLQVLIDCRMTKHPPEYELDVAPLVIGLGPGFVAGENCQAVIETKRGHYLGRVIWQGPPEADSGIPESMAERSIERVLRAPTTGVFQAQATIGDHLEPGQIAGEVDGQPVRAAFSGVLRGLLHSGITVPRNAKIGDLDARDDPRLCTLVSDKALAIGGGALEAILTNPDLRHRLWD